MKRLIGLLLVLITSIASFAEDRNAYVSNVEHYSDRTIVTISAKESALRAYPDGFMVGVRPANHVFDLFITTSHSEQQIRLTPDQPSQKVIFGCSEDYNSRKACKRNDFVVHSRP